MGSQSVHNIITFAIYVASVECDMIIPHNTIIIQPIFTIIGIGIQYLH